MPLALTQALQHAVGVDKDWFFCRGYFLQATNSFRPYTKEELSELNLSCTLPKVDL